MTGPFHLGGLRGPRFLPPAAGVDADRQIAEK
jgi:hypothetical protein